MSDLETNKAIYDSKFYEQYKETELSVALIIVPTVLEILSQIKTINSVLDVGCGLGGWLRVFNQHGINDIVGIDGAYVNKDDLFIERSAFKEADLEQPLILRRKFDLVSSIEVAEHISEENAAKFVDSLCRHGDIILFSAAIPHQGGEHHVNEQFPSYWAKLFAQRGYICCDCIRKRIWNDSKIPVVYRQNIMFYIKKGLIESNCNPDFFESHIQIDIVHPVVYFAWLADYAKHILDSQNK